MLSTGDVFTESDPLIMTDGRTISRATAYSLDPFRRGETPAPVALTNLLASRFARFGGAEGTRTKKATR